MFLSHPIPLLICTWFLKNQVGEIKFDELDFQSVKTNFEIDICRLHRQQKLSSKQTKNPVHRTLFFKVQINREFGIYDFGNMLDLILKYSTIEVSALGIITRLLNVDFVRHHNTYAIESICPAPSTLLSRQGFLLKQDHQSNILESPLSRLL